MKNKIKKIINIDFIYWSIITICTIKEILLNKSIRFDGEILDFRMLGIKEYLNVLLGFGFILLFCFIITMFKTFYLTVLYIGTKIAKKKFIIDKLDKNDFKNDNYYRDIIGKYSPGILSYIDDFKLEKRDIVATLMSLELKNKISISEKIEVINDEIDQLDENEKFILDSIKNYNIEDIDIKKFEKIVVKDCIKKGLLEKNENIKKKIIREIIACILFYISIVFAFNNMPIILNKMFENNIMVFLGMFIILITFGIMVFFPFCVAVYIKKYYFLNKYNTYVRNKKAKELNKKLEGLKKYIEDFSLLDEKDHKSLALWKEYLIYSIIFGKNEKIVNEIVLEYDKINKK